MRRAGGGDSCVWCGMGSGGGEVPIESQSR